jgi:hypothetical protein
MRYRFLELKFSFIKNKKNPTFKRDFRQKLRQKTNWNGKFIKK